MPRLALDPNVAGLGEASNSDQGSEQPDTAPTEDDRDNKAKLVGQRPDQTVAGSYIISQQSAMKLVSEVRRRAYMHMVPHRWKQDTRFKTDDIVWREDMDTFVLDLMRRKTVRLLRYLSSLPAAYIAKCENYQDIQSKHQPGAVLWLGGHDADDVSNTLEEAPPPYAMVKYRAACHIPVYNLCALLSTEYLGQLRASSQLFHGTLAVVKQKSSTMDALMHLWRLMGYMASNAELN